MLTPAAKPGCRGRRFPCLSSHVDSGNRHGAVPVVLVLGWRPIRNQALPNLDAGQSRNLPPYLSESIKTIGIRIPAVAKRPRPLIPFRPLSTNKPVTETTVSPTATKSENASHARLGLTCRQLI